MRALLALMVLLVGAQAAIPVSARQAVAKAPLQAGAAKQNSPGYRLKPGEFPPVHSEHLVYGELVEEDYIHRSGVFRSDGTGQLMSFTLPPFGSVSYLGAEADLRDVPLGTQCGFFLYQDDKGVFSQAVVIQDTYTEIARTGLRFHLDNVDATTGRILVTLHTVHATQIEPDAAPEEFLIDDRTQVWKGEKQGKLSDLVKGDWLLCNFTQDPRGRLRRCTAMWVGEAAEKYATEQQRKTHFAFLRARGLPAWVDQTDGDKMTVTLFSSEPATLRALLQQDGLDPVQWAKEHRRLGVGVANEHLRTYLPNVTNRGAKVLELQSAPTDCYGCSGVRLVLQPELMLEGFRKGHIVRLSPPSWPIEAMPFGEGLYAGGHDEEPADSKELQPADFPYRTDFGNENLGWYQLQPGKFPPDHSEHRVGGELVKVDVAHHTGQFRMDRTEEVVDFTLESVGRVRYLAADAALEDLPLGMRCLFFLYQDEKGAFTRAAVIEDEFSYLAENTLTYRLESTQLNAGKLMVARHAAPVKVDYILEPRDPPDFGRIELEVDAKTRVWKGGEQIKLTDLAVGDILLVNLAARTTTSRGRCTDIWVGTDTHRLATEQQRKRHAAANTQK